MNTTITGNQFLDALAIGLTSLLTGLMEQIFGPGVQTVLFYNIAWADLGVLLFLVTSALFVNGLTATFLRRKIRQAEAHPDSKEWRTQLWQTVGRPLYVLIWVYGACLAATPILLKLPSEGGLQPVLVLFEKLFDVGVFVVLFWLFYRFTHVIETRMKFLTGKTESKLDDLLVPLLGRSLRIVLPVVGIIFALPMIGFSPEFSGLLAKASSILIIGSVAYVLFQGVGLIEQAVVAKYDIKAANNLQARKVYTQVHVLSKTLYVIISIFTVASVLMLFDEVRRFGASILASAGVVGIIIGFAAQRTIANLFAGLQLAMTQPIRLDDVVIVEGEWGRIEEITLTYVIVHIWDDRRLVVPLSYFIEKPFQNWTRVSADLLGSVFIWADYSLPIEELRPAVQRIVEGCKDWDKRFWNVQVTDTTERTMQIRILATSTDASKGWDLRCEIREKILAFLQQKYPQCLPKVRADLGAGLKPAGELSQPVQK